MHEMSIAAGLMEKLLEFTREHPGRRILQVRLMVGELANLELDQLRFCYGSIIVNTVLEGSELDFEPIETVVQCPQCAYLGPPKYWEEALAFTSPATLRCPGCGGAAEAVQGHECAIKNLRYREIQSDDLSP